MGGRASGSPSGSQFVQYIQIQTLGNAIDFGSLLAAKDDLGGCSDCIRALAYGGGSTVIEYLTIATGGDSIDFGDGQTSSGYTDTIGKLQISTEGNTTDFGNLISGLGYMGSTADSTRAITAGGYDPSASPSNYINTIQYVSISTGGTAVDFGDRTVAGSYLSGTSNGHGGLS